MSDLQDDQQPSSLPMSDLQDDQQPFSLPMSVLLDEQPPSSLPMSVLQDSLGHLSGENEGFSCVDYYLSDPSDASVDADEPVPSSLPMSVLQPNQPPQFDSISQDSEAIIQPSQNNAGISETLGFFNGMS